MQIVVNQRRLTKPYCPGLFFIGCGAYIQGFPHGSVGKGSACSAGDLGLIPGSGRSPGEVNGSPFQYSCLENPMDRGAWQATVHGVTRVRHKLATRPPLPYFEAPSYD